MILADRVWYHRKALLSIVLLLCAVGAWTVAHLPVAIFPPLVVPRIVVSVDAGDIPIPTTLTTVTRPLEAAVSTVPGVVKVYTSTTRGSAELDVTFGWDTDMQVALQKLQSQVTDARAALPSGTSVTTAIINASIFPILGCSLTSDREDLGTLRNLAIYTMRPRLARLPGIAQVRVTGGDVPEFLVSVRPEALLAHALTMQDVVDALARANTMESVGTFDRAYQRYDVMVSGLLQDETDVARVTVASHGQVPIAIGELGTVTRSVRPPTVLASGNGHPAVVIDVIKQPAANTIEVADAVRTELAALRHSMPADVSTSLFYDQSEIVRQSEASVIEAISVGGVLALLVLMLFLGNLRAATIVLLLLPLTLLVAFGAMRAMGQTLNIMTLGAIAIALGLVIDDGIVVVEDMFVSLEQGHPRPVAVAQGLRSITPGMIGSSLTTMAAFLPLTLLTGVTGQFFAPLALVMMATLFVSLCLALFLTPLLARFILPLHVSTTTSDRGRWWRWLPDAIERLGHAYARLLLWCLPRRFLVWVLMVPLLALSAWLYTRVETGFFPEFDEGAFVIDYFTPPGTSLAETNAICLRVEKVLASTPEVAAWSRLTGARSGSGLELTEPNQGDILVRLKEARTRPADEIMDAIRDRLSHTEPGFQCDLVQMLQDGIGDIEGAPQPIEVKLFGEDPALLRTQARRVADAIGKIDGVVEVNAGIVQTGPALKVQVDSQSASRFGVSTADVTTAATAALRGTIATTIQSQEQPVDVRVRARAGGPSLDWRTVSDVLLASPGHAAVRLSQVARLTEEPGTAELTRENQQPMTAVTARLEGLDLGRGIRAVQHAVANLGLPPGVRIEYGGLYASQQQSFAQLTQVLVLAVMLISSLLLLQFRSFRQVFALMVAALLSQSGVLVALVLTHTALNISSFTGAIMIIGVITENGVFMFDTFNVRRAADPTVPIETVMARAGQERLRPILMTKIGAILAMLPLALGFGAGAAMQKPLAIAVIGGLCMAAVFTLIVAPALYLALEQRGGWLERLWTPDPAPDAPGSPAPGAGPPPPGWQ